MAFRFSFRWTGGRSLLVLCAVLSVYACEFASRACAGTGTLIETTALPSFDFLGQPQSPASPIPRNESFTLSVKVSSPTPVTYQWYHDEWPIPGATEATYSSSSLPDWVDPIYGMGLYTVAVTNAAGTVVSDPALVIIRPAGTLPDPVLLWHPRSRELNPGEMIRLYVPAIGTGAAGGGATTFPVFPSGLAYQWFKDDAPLTDGGRVSGTSSAILTIQAAEASDAGRYRVTVTGGGASSPLTSLAAEITVLGAPVIADWNSSVYVTHHGLGLLAPPVKAAQPATYVWSRNGVPLPDDGRFPGSRTAEMMFGRFEEADAGTYVLTVSNSFGTSSSKPIEVKYLLTRQWIGDASIWNPTYNSPPLPFTLASTSGLPVTIKVVSGPATYANGELSFQDVGRVKLRATQTGDAIYAPAEPVELEFDVNPMETAEMFLRTPSYWFTGKRVQPDLITSPPGLNLEVSYTITIDGNWAVFPSGEEIEVSEPIWPGHYTAYVRVNDPRVAASGSYPHSFTFTILVPSQSQTLVFPQPAAVTYGDQAVPLVATTSSGLPAEFAVIAASPPGIATLLGNKLTLLGAGQVKIQARQLGGNGFGTAAPVTRTLSINKAPLAVSFAPARRLVRQPNPALVPTYAGFVNGDAETDLAATRPHGVTKALPASPEGQYPISPRGGSDPNYRFVPGEPAFLTVIGFGGTYEALVLDPETELPLGKLSLTVPNNALTYTGNLQLAAEAAPIPLLSPLLATSDLSSAGQTFTRAASASLPGLGLAFQVSPTGVTGSVTRGGAPFGTLAQGALLAPPAAPLGNAAYTLVLNPITDASAPGGAGYATATVAAKTGLLKLAGKLADGTPLTASVSPAPDRSYRLWVNPYGKRLDSYVGGALALKPHPAPARFPGLHHLPIAEGRLTWAKGVSPAKPLDASYRDGFGPLDLTVTVDPWLPPSTKPTVLNGTTLPAATLAQRLGLTGSPAVLGLEHDAIEGTADDSLPDAASLTGNLLTPAMPNPTAWKITKLDPATGAFTGSFVLRDQITPPPAKPVVRTVNFSGVLRQRPDFASSTDSLIGAGHFLVAPAGADASAEKITGALQFTAP